MDRQVARYPTAKAAIANSEDLGIVISSTPSFLAACGWELVKVRDVKKLTIEISSIGDQARPRVAETALQQAYGLVVYVEAVTDLNS